MTSVTDGLGERERERIHTPVTYFFLAYGWRCVISLGQTTSCQELREHFKMQEQLSVCLVVTFREQPRQWTIGIVSYRLEGRDDR